MGRSPVPGRVWWLTLGILPIALITWLCLTPELPQGAPHFWDKAEHALAFAALGFWFRAAGYSTLAVLSSGLSYGILLEVLQALGGVRTGEWQDVLGDAIGLMGGELVVRTPVGTYCRLLGTRFLTSSGLLPR